ncbi:zinc-binding dehydrogenase [Streptomyces canus]|uniref:zinc-binding dehydrogenase n=1 Tax=Streptomyces canus TaxID=58343 RepID=UPI000AF50370|nr:zinc-binding dehydrogenase [Streptomyces canus]
MPRTYRGLGNLSTGIAIPGHQGPGAYAAYVVRDERLFLPVPDHVDLEQAAVTLWPYGTSHRVLRDRLRVTAGDTLLVTGAAGPMGLATIQLAQLFGLRVIATTRHAERADALRTACSAEVVVTDDLDAARHAVRDLTHGQGVDHAVDYSTTPIRTEDGAPLGGLFFGQSSLARHAVVSAQSVVRVDVADEEELSLMAPVGCGIQTGAGAILNLLKPHYGDSVAVFGAGAVGLSAVMAARLTPARTIVAVDVVPSRLALATELGATHTIDSSKEDLQSRLADLAGPGGLTYIVETTGVPALLELAATAIAADGTVAPSAGSRASFDINALIDGRTIRGVTEGGSDRTTFIPALIDLARQGRLPYEKFVRFYAEDRLHQAVTDARSGHTIKPVICFDNRTGEER